MTKVLRGTVLVGLAVLAVAAFCGTASAVTKAKWSEKQTLPGLTERTIWGQNQVFVYQIPKTVNHYGVVHIELTYSSADDDCFIYLLGPVAAGSSEWQFSPGTYRQGSMSTWPGKQVIDYDVTSLFNANVTDEGIQGDAFYVVVKAMNGVKKIRLSGYIPRTKTEGVLDPASEDTFTRYAWSYPSATGWKKVSGAAYGGGFDFTPTSQGLVEARLQYPADVKARTVATTTAAMPAAFEQYVYQLDWTKVPVDQPCDPANQYSHWDLLNQNRHAAAPLAGADWYGLQGTFTVERGGAWQPLQLLHYDPVLWLVSSQPYASAPSAVAPPAAGLQTLGYKATLLIPQNLRLVSATKKVRKGKKAKIKGTLAVPSDATVSASVSWAPAGTVVVIQKKAGKKWVTAKKVKTGANGAWKAVIKVRKTTTWRATWAGGNGIAAEQSLTKKTTVKR